jgi:hypothetical protein
VKLLRKRVKLLRKEDLWVLTTRTIDTRDVGMVESVCHALEAQRVKVRRLLDSRTRGSLLHYAIFRCGDAPEVSAMVLNYVDVNHKDKFEKSVLSILGRMQAKRFSEGWAKLLELVRKAVERE